MQFKTKNGTTVNLLTDSDIYNLELGSYGNIPTSEIPSKMAEIISALPEEIKNKLQWKTFIGHVTFGTHWGFIGMNNPYLSGYWGFLMVNYFNTDNNSYPLHITIEDGVAKGSRINTTAM